MAIIRSVQSRLIGSLRPSIFWSPGVAHSNSRAQQHRGLHSRVTAAAEEDIPEPQEPGPEDCCQSELEQMGQTGSSVRPNDKCLAIWSQVAAWSASGSSTAARCSNIRLRKPGSVGRPLCLQRTPSRPWRGSSLSSSSNISNASRSSRAHHSVRLSCCTQQNCKFCG